MKRHYLPRGPREPLPATLHRQHHNELHRALDELLADFLAHSPERRPNETTVSELLAWSHRQAEKPDELA